MSTDEYTPDVSTERVRGAATGEQNVPVTPEQFARWLAERDRQVAERTRERIAQAIEVERPSDEEIASNSPCSAGHGCHEAAAYVAYSIAARIAMRDADRIEREGGWS